jgi:hypothetical protein
MLWFRVYNEMRNDTKLRLIAVALDTEEAFVHGMWVDLLCLAAELDQDWHLRVDEDHPLTFDQVSEEVRVKRDTGGVTAASFLAKAVEYGLVKDTCEGLAIVSGKRRNAKPSDSKEAVLQRVHRHRQAKKEEASDDDVQRDTARYVTPQEVEVEEELNPLTPTESSPPSLAPKISAPTEVDWQRRADDLLERSHFPSDLLQLGEILAGENKTGKASLSRIVRQLYEPIVELQNELSDEQLRHGLRAAITASAPNWHYVRKAARGYERPATAVLPPKRPICPECEMDLTYDEAGQHCPVCGYRPPSPDHSTKGAPLTASSLSVMDSRGSL